MLSASWCICSVTLLGPGRGCGFVPLVLLTVFYPQIKCYPPFPFLPAGTPIQNLLAGAGARYRAATQGHTGSLWQSRKSTLCQNGQIFPYSLNSEPKQNARLYSCCWGEKKGLCRLHMSVAVLRAERRPGAVTQGCKWPSKSAAVRSWAPSSSNKDTELLCGAVRSLLSMMCTKVWDWCFRSPWLPVMKKWQLQSQF